MAEDKSSSALSDEQGLLSAAREFARSLADSTQFKALERAQRSLMADQPAMQALKEFGDFQERLGWLVQQGLASAEDKAELARLEKAMLSHETVRSFLDAQTELAGLCQEASGLISSLIGMNLTGGCGCGC